MLLKMFRDDLEMEKSPELLLDSVSLLDSVLKAGWIDEATEEFEKEEKEEFEDCEFDLESLE